jgi:hypothetical protein
MKSAVMKQIALPQSKYMPYARIVSTKAAVLFQIQQLIFVTFSGIRLQFSP